MKIKKRFSAYIIFVVLAISASPVCASDSDVLPWPPVLPGAHANGTATLCTDLFLKTPTSVTAQAGMPGVAPFMVATTAQTIDIAYHDNLPNPAINGTGWSAWGEIDVAGDGSVYSGIGDHGVEETQASHAYIYKWIPSEKKLKQVVDLNAIVKRENGEPTWSKVHAKVAEGSDGQIYFTGTLNDGNRANQEVYKWSDKIPGGQLYRYDPITEKAEVYANLPPAHCSATALIDRDRNRWWCNLEAGPNALHVIDLTTGEAIYTAPAGSMQLNRSFALAKDGMAYFNGSNGLWRCDATAGEISPTDSSFGADAGIRCCTDETKKGWIYGVSMGGQLFRYAPGKDKLEILGPNFIKGEYTASCVLSPDERFLYFLPGSHGSAFTYGTPVIQYSISTGQRKVIAFIRDAFEFTFNYTPGGTYGVAINSDGSILFANLNGHAGDSIRPSGMRAGGFGLTAFIAIHIPESERK